MALVISLYIYDRHAVDSKVAKMTGRWWWEDSAQIFRDSVWSGAKGGLPTGSILLWEWRWSLKFIWSHSQVELGTGLSEIPTPTPCSLWFCITSVLSMYKLGEVSQFLKRFQLYLMDCSLETLTRVICSVGSTIECLVLIFPGSHGL